MSNLYRTRRSFQISHPNHHHSHHHHHQPQQAYLLDVQRRPPKNENRVSRIDSNHPNNYYEFGGSAGILSSEFQNDVFHRVMQLVSSRNWQEEQRYDTSDEEDMVDTSCDEDFVEEIVAKYVKTRTHHHARAKEYGCNPTDEAESCAICQAEYEVEDAIGTLQCGHEYHIGCIKQWLLRKRDCPMCRTSVLNLHKKRIKS